MHSIPNPWDGTIVCIATGRGHSEPVWWDGQARLRLPDGVGPNQTQMAHCFPQPVYLALSLHLDVIHVIPRQGSPSHNESFRAWATGKTFSLTSTLLTPPPDKRETIGWCFDYLPPMLPSDCPADIAPADVRWCGVIYMFDTYPTHSTREEIQDGHLPDLKCMIDPDQAEFVAIWHEHYIVWAAVPHEGARRINTYCTLQDAGADEHH